MSNHLQSAIVSLAAIAPDDDRLHIPPEDIGKLNIDVLSGALTRAQSILLLLSCNGQDLSRGFEINHKYVMDALWCVEGLLTQAQNHINQVEIVRPG